jgi:hypothetical protein
MSLRVTERPPLAGQSYVAFVVHPRQPGPSTLAIAHRQGDQYVIDLCRDGLTIQQAADLCRDGLTIQQAADLVKAYGISKVTGADDEGDSNVSLAHAVCGVISLLRDAHG